MEKALNWTLEEKSLILKYNWKISRNESTSKKNFFIKVSDGENTGQGEAAPNIRFGETPETIQEAFKIFREENPQTPEGVQKSCMGLPNALSFAVESAYIHYLSTKANLSVSQFLNLPSPVPIATSYTLPIMETGEIAAFIKKYNLARFKSLKLKVNAENAVELTREVAKSSTQAIRIDANEAFKNPDRVLQMLELVKDINIAFIEQPFPATLVDEAIYLKKNSPIEIFADESITNNPNWVQIEACFHGINMKLMKAGGYYQGIKILQEAKKRNLKTMIGCMVETSLGISSALNISRLSDFFDLDGCFIIEQDPFQLIEEKTGMLFLGYE